ncbi:mannose-6-phosphate isomerase, class I [Rhodococcus sp. D2-41]|uniref:mannose-6-phosphate isomerase n=1 Tax=Speluncibacter jeojiensis TaxID=2710754 RepID=A0A9X4LXF4_9ACTN|nr:mannose-6-phosphate isomerase, class I [Rhodococcus sp. D2-41]MDG3008799.1 mannose-6-phosphate isomerase, class I [Rhodococcus sp. D2-41]MDG3012992.1 mannose-6-phosphate isomerase, class I [Corynebacteriales bacterium D3-21]
MRLLEGAVRPYAWGSRTAIATLSGRPSPTPHPEAELWMGAHPANPARLLGPEGSRSLLDALGDAPERQLGTRSRAAFGDRLPFLLKLLAADEPLSLQAHPSMSQAEEGYEREERLGVPLDSPIRNYRDRNHKPELVVALTEFHALAGFRDPARTVEFLSALDVPELEPHIGLLRGQPDAAGLRALFTTWITLPQPVLDALVPAVLDGCVRHLSAGDAPFRDEVRTALELGETYPGDAGVLASLLLNRVTLEPGQGLYLAAGNLHAYLQGMAVEIMANSDNVLRGGLTPKHVDVAELLRVLDFSAVDATALTGTPTDAGEFVYRTQAPEFRLSRIELDVTAEDRDAAVAVDDDGPQILLCTLGTVIVRCADQVLELSAGQSLWIPAADPGAVVKAEIGRAQVFRATIGPR